MFLRKERKYDWTWTSFRRNIFHLTCTDILKTKFSSIINFHCYACQSTNYEKLDFFSKTTLKTLSTKICLKNFISTPAGRLFCLFIWSPGASKSMQILTLHCLQILLCWTSFVHFHFSFSNFVISFISLAVFCSNIWIVIRKN